MFDIGFAELIVIGVVGLLVIGPERLPGAIRTASVWLGRLRRGFNDLKREVQQELHNDEVMRELRNTGAEIRQQATDIKRDLSDTAAKLKDLEAPPSEGTTQTTETQDSASAGTDDAAGKDAQA